MTKQISIKFKFGWISVFEDEGKIFKVQFGKLNKQTPSKVLLVFKKNLLKFFDKKITKIMIPHNMTGSIIQKKVWNELKNIKIGQTKSYGEIAKKYRLSPRHVGKICSQNMLLLLILMLNLTMIL